MNSHALQQRVAVLETQVDMLQTELSYLDELLVRAGFNEGIETLKATVMELLAEDAEASLSSEKSHHFES